MPLFGAHVGGGVKADLSDAKELGCQAAQIFTHSPSSWSITVPHKDSLKALRDNAKRFGIDSLIAHSGYLINLGTRDNRVFYGSLSTVKKEIELCDIYGCAYLVLHVGKHKEATHDEGIAQVAKALNLLKEDLMKFKSVDILMETVAGQGTEIGVRFADLNRILQLVDKDIQHRIGVCLDTCHIFAAGYDLASAEGIKRTMQEIKDSFGFQKVKCIHVNDSKGKCGDNLDRHENIGKGHIGYEGLKAFLTQKEWKDTPMILETPEGETLDHATEIVLLRKMFGR